MCKCIRFVCCPPGYRSTRWALVKQLLQRFQPICLFVFSGSVRSSVRLLAIRAASFLFSILFVSPSFRSFFRGHLCIFLHRQPLDWQRWGLLCCCHFFFQLCLQLQQSRAVGNDDWCRRPLCGDVRRLPQTNKLVNVLRATASPHSVIISSIVFSTFYYFISLW